MDFCRLQLEETHCGDFFSGLTYVSKSAGRKRLKWLRNLGIPPNKLSFNSREWSNDKENYQEIVWNWWANMCPSQRNSQKLWWTEPIWKHVRKENPTIQPQLSDPPNHSSALTPGPAKVLQLYKLQPTRLKMRLAIVPFANKKWFVSCCCCCCCRCCRCCCCRCRCCRCCCCCCCCCCCFPTWIFDEMGGATSNFGFLRFGIGDVEVETHLESRSCLLHVCWFPVCIWYYMVKEQRNFLLYLFINKPQQGSLHIIAQ